MIVWVFNQSFNYCCRLRFLSRRCIKLQTDGATTGNSRLYVCVRHMLHNSYGSTRPRSGRIGIRNVRHERLFVESWLHAYAIVPASMSAQRCSDVTMCMQLFGAINRCIVPHDGIPAASAAAAVRLSLILIMAIWCACFNAETAAALSCSSITALSFAAPIAQHR